MKRRLISVASIALLVGLASGAVPAQAATGPLPIVKATWADTYLPPGGSGIFELQVRNIGDADLGPGFTITEELPAGVKATKVRWTKHFISGGGPGAETCAITEEGAKVTCTLDDLDAAMELGPAAGVEFGAFYPEPSGYLAFPAKLQIEVAVDPAASGSATGTATVVNPITIATAKEGGSGSDEAQAIAIKATAGQFKLTATTATATGTLAFGSKDVTGLSTTLGAFHAGDEISGGGIPTGRGEGEISTGSATVSKVKAYKTNVFAAGQAVSGYGIPAGTTITKVENYVIPGIEGTFFKLTLSAPATASGTTGLVAETTVAALGPGTLTLSAAAIASGPQALAAKQTTAPIAFDAPAAGPSSVQAALVALPGIGAGNVTVTGGPGDATGQHPYLVTFSGALAGADLAPIEARLAATLLSGGAPDFTDTDQVSFSPTPAPFGIVPGSFAADLFSDAYPFGEPARQAGDHPFEQRVSFDLNRYVGENVPGASPSALVRTVEVTLPRGMIGNPEALPKCEQADFAEEGSFKSGTACPANTQLGYLTVMLQGGPLIISRIPLYSLEPPRGTPVDLGFTAAGYVQGHIYAQLDPAQSYAIKSLTPDIGAFVAPLGTEVTLWGVPADPAHDFFRVYPEKQEDGDVAGAPFGGAAIRPFFTNPMDCGFDNGGHRIRVESYTEPGVFTPVEEYSNPDNVNGCEDLRFRFQPKVSLQPTSTDAGAPTGLDVHLEVPQRDDRVKDAKELYAENGDVQGISTPPLKKAVVTMPEGMTLNPSAAQGLGSCAPDQIKLGTIEPVTCPDNSQYGTLTLHTPIMPIDEQPTGRVYIAQQNDNPFHSFLALYLVIEEPERGILIKIPGRLDLDPVTGQITTTFDDLPQFPVSDMQMTIKGGVRAGLVNPTTCGTKTIRAEFFSWHDPTTPHPVEDHYEVTQKPDGSPCVNSLAERPFKPALAAGTLNPTAGEYSPFVFRLTRTDDDQEFSQLGVTLPQGLAAKFAGVGICSEAGIAQALARETVAGDGALEQASPSCPASSQIGTTQVGTGVGVPLTYVPGKVYLAGPYKGAPISIVVISPAIVGPYDLGVITVRTALKVNPETAQGEALSDSFPQIFQGIPVRIRDIRLKLDRPDFTLNPTSCAEKQITAHITGTGGDLKSTADDTAADLANRFQATDCASLGFKPQLSFRLFGGTQRGSHPKLRAVVRARPGDANIAAASVALPRSEFLDQGHIRTVCTRVQFAAKECPEGAVYGHAVAKTPLFDQPLKGPVYLRSSSHKLPDLVAALRGPDAQPVEVDLVGRIDSVRGGIRNSFEVVPDAPVTKFTLTMQGGKKGLLVNSTDLCAQVNRATAKFIAQNGRRRTLRPRLRASCKKQRQGKAG